jgi:hypothetical protein
LLSPSRARGHPAYFSSSMGHCRCLACSKAKYWSRWISKRCCVFAGG